MLNRRVKSRFLLGTVTVGVTSSFSVSANAGKMVASGNSSDLQFLNWGKSILSSKYFYVPVVLILLVLYFYNREQSSSGGSSEFVLKESEQEAQERNDAINKFFYERNVLPILKNIRESETKEELLALRKKFQRLERYQGVVSPNEYIEINDVLYSPKVTEAKGGHKYKKIIASIRILIKENFSVWADMCAGNFSLMEAEEKTRKTAQKLTESLLTLMKELQKKGQLQVNDKIDWDDNKIPISKKLKSISEVKAAGLKKIAEWTWKNFFIDIDMGYKEDLEPVATFISTLKEKYRKISGWLSTNFRDGVISEDGKIEEIDKEKVLRRHKKDKFVDSINEKMVKSLNLEGRGISSII